MATTDLDYRLRVISDQLGAALDANNKKANTLENSLSTAIGVFAGTVALKGVSLLADGISSLVSVARDAVKASAEQEKATNNLNSALARAGNFSEEASKQLQEFSSQIQNTSTFTDDAVQENLALLQSLTSLSVDGLQRAQQAAVNFAAVTGKDLTTATTLVAKAAEGSTEAFRRYGVTVQKTGDQQKDFETLLTRLEAQFGGGAAAQLKTFEGSLKSLQLAYGDLLEPVGDIITKNPTLIATFNVLKDVIVDFTKSLEGGSESISSGISAAIQDAIDLFQGLISVVDVVNRTITVAFNSITAGVAQVAKSFFDLTGSIASLASNIPGVGSKFQAFADEAAIASETLAESIAEDGKQINDALFNATALSSFNAGLDSVQAKIIETSETLKNNPITPKNADQTAAQRAEAERQALITDALLQGAAERALIEQQIALDSENVRREIENLQIENQFARQEEELQRIAEFEAQKLEAEFTAKEEKAKLIQNDAQRTAELAKIAKERELAFTKQGNIALLNEEKNKIQRRQQLEAGYLASAQGFLNAGLALTRGNAKDQQKIAAAQALVNTYQAGTRAYRDYPFPANIAVLAATIAQGVAQVASIKSQSFATGGVVGGFQGASDGSDNTVVNARNGEMFLNANQQRKLFNQIESGGSGGDIIIQVDGVEIARAVRNQVRQGFSLA